LLNRARCLLGAVAAATLIAAAAAGASVPGTVEVVTLGSVGVGPVSSPPRSAAIFYGRVTDAEPFTAWFEFRVACGGHPIYDTRHRDYGPSPGGRRLRGKANGLPVLETSCYRLVAESQSGAGPVYGGWRIQPNFGSHGGPPNHPLPEKPDG
jgi:hypothetical protein